MVGCGTIKPKKTTDISQTNQAPTQIKYVKKTETKTEVLPDGTIVITETTLYEDADGELATSVRKKQGQQSDIKSGKAPKLGVSSEKFNNNTSTNTSGLPKPRSTFGTGTKQDINTAKNAKYMSRRAQDMIREINLVRSNPRAYIREVQAYRERVKNTEYTDLNHAKKQMRAIDDLINELQIMSPMPILQPRLTLYKTAQKHGMEILTTGTPSHVGVDGSYPWDRILRDDTSLQDGNENLVGGPADVKESLMLLLVDAGIPGYGHRRVLLNSTWKYVACYEIGKVGDIPNYWVQCFAK